MRARAWAITAVMAGAVVVLAARPATGVREQGLTQLDGRQWAQYSPAEKRAFVSGFLNGAALADAERAGGADSGMIRRALDSLRQDGNLRFPFGHVVYATQLDDFYWWTNHVPIPLSLALRDINLRLKRQDR